MALGPTLIAALGALAGAAIGAAASIYATLRANKETRKLQADVFQQAVSMEDRRSLIRLYEQIRDRYMVMSSLDREREESGFGGIATDFNPATGKDIDVPVYDRELQTVLREAEIIAPDAYCEALNDWVDSIYFQFWRTLPEGRRCTVKSISEARVKALEEVRVAARITSSSDV